MEHRAAWHGADVLVSEGHGPSFRVQLLPPPRSGSV